MKEKFDKLMEWVKANPLIAAGVGLAVAFFLLPKLFKRSVRRRRRRIPRSVGIRRRRRTSVRRRYSKTGKALKPWQIKGSEAARRHMRKIRAMR